MMGDRAEELRQAAQRLRNRGDHAAAAQVYRELETLEPEEPLWPKKLAECLEHDERELDVVTAALGRAARLYAARGFIVRAIAIHKMILRRAPADPTALDALVTLQARRVTGLARYGLTGPISTVPALDGPVHDQLADSAGFSVASGVFEISLRPHGDTAPPELELEALASSPIFARLSEASLRHVVDAARLLEVSAGELVYRKGDDASAMYVVVEGRIALMADVNETPVAELGAGDVLGVVGLCASAPRPTNAVAREPTVLLEIPRASLDDLLRAAPEVRYALLDLARQRLLAVLLSTHPLFRTLSDATRVHLQDRFRFFEVTAGSQLVKPGAAPNHLYVLMTGRLEMIGVDGEVVAAFGSGSLAAEVEFLARTPVVMPIVASCKSFVLALPLADFEDLSRLQPQFRLDLMQEANAPVWDPASIS